MVLINTVLPFLLVLGVLIFVHELGHFLVARWYGVRVLTFSLGFGPKILKVKRGDTEYCVSAVPLGGYVKMAGETLQDERVGAPDEFLSKSKWVRFQVYLAGPAMNVLLAVVVMTAVLANGADIAKYSSAPPVIGTMADDSAAAKAGMQIGDRILSVNGSDVPTWDALLTAILPNGDREVTLVIDRQGKHQTLTVVPTAEKKYRTGSLGIGPLLRPQVIGTRPHMPAERGGIQRGDVLVSVGGQPRLNKEQIIAIIRKQGPNPLVFGIERNGQLMELTVTPEGAPGSSLIGLDFASAEYDHIDPSLPEAFKLSLQQNWDNSKAIGQQLTELVTFRARVDQLLGPIAIADLSGTAASLGILSLLNLVAMISLNLALLNLMPVPVLDGGQIAILLLEGLTRRDFSVKMKERVAMVGAALILMLMVTVLYNDIARILR